jgi:hypothetical protein
MPASASSQTLLRLIAHAGIALTEDERARIQDGTIPTTPAEHARPVDVHPPTW